MKKNLVFNDKEQLQFSIPFYLCPFTMVHLLPVISKDILLPNSSFVY